MNSLSAQHAYEWKSTAPANTMLLGEHSVVYGHPALACAVNQYIDIHWQQRDDQALNIFSSLGEHHTCIEHMQPHANLSFVMEALRAFKNVLPFGLDVHIKSQFSSTIGLGSSAAVLAAMLKGLDHICRTQYNTVALFKLGHRIIIDIQKRGSGTDLAASLAGGIIYFQPQSDQFKDPIIKSVQCPLDLILIYCGYKTPTADVLEKVAINWQDKPEQLAKLYQSMAESTQRAYQYITHRQMDSFYAECSQYQALMSQLGVNDDTLQSIISTLRNCEHIKAAKISGSGLGDCVLGIGKLDAVNNSIGANDQNLQQYKQIQIEIAQLGAHCQRL